MYDAIIVGARCAGSPTAMLLSRKGYKVLLVDRASFPSDIIFEPYSCCQNPDGNTTVKKGVGRTDTLVP